MPTQHCQVLIYCYMCNIQYADKPSATFYFSEIIWNWEHALRGWWLFEKWAQMLILNARRSFSIVSWWKVRLGAQG